MLVVLVCLEVAHLYIVDAHSMFSPMYQGETTDPSLAMQCVANCTALHMCVAVNISFTDDSCNYLDTEGYKQVITQNHNSFIYRRSMPIVCYNGGRWSDSSKRSCECTESFTGEHCERYWIDCSEGFRLGEKVSKVYHIKPTLSLKAFEVYCEMTWGGRTYIQKHKTGVNFNRTWEEYRDGFGLVSADHWLGLEKIRLISSGGSARLVIHLKFNCCPSWRQGFVYKFNLSDEGDGYRLGFKSTATVTNINNELPDAMMELKGSAFSTFDRDNDEKEGGNCAVSHGSGWWFKSCGPCNLNGRLSSPADNTISDLTHAYWLGDDRAMTETLMSLTVHGS